MERRADDARLIRIETILETHLVKLVEGLDTLKELQIEAKENKDFRTNHEKSTNILIDRKLNTIEFEKSVKKTIDEEVKKIFDEREVREDFENKVKAIIKSENKNILLGVYVRVTLFVSTIATALSVSIIKGLLK